MSNLIVVPNELAGWDVVRDDDPRALTNVQTKEQAIEAARLRVAEEGEGGVLVDEEHTHSIDSTRGVKTYFLLLVGLLAAVVVIIVVTALLASSTGT